MVGDEERANEGLQSMECSGQERSLDYMGVDSFAVSGVEGARCQAVHV